MTILAPLMVDLIVRMEVFVELGLFAQIYETKGYGHNLDMLIGAIHDWGITFGTKELRTISHWISAFFL